MKEDFLENKLPGKTLYAGRRRPATRRSGFKVHGDTTGGEFQCVEVPTFLIGAGETIQFAVRFPKHRPGEFLGFGGWFTSDKPVVSPGPITASGFFMNMLSGRGSRWACSQ